MKTSLRALAALLTLLACALPGRAADAKSSADLVTVSAPEKPVPPLSINVDFPGGSINKLLAAIGKADGVSFNIIAGNEAADLGKVELPAFALRNVQLLSVIEVLMTLLEPRGFQLRPVSGGNPNSFVCILNRREVARDKQPSPPTGFISYQLGPYLAAQSVDDIVGALHTAWELEPSHDRDALHVKFHPGTSILLVSGPSEALTLTRSVLNELKRPAERKTAMQPGEAAPPEKR